MVGGDTDFCISTIEGNLYSSYATEQKIDPYFIIDKLAQSSDPMRKFTIAIQYDESGKFKISDDSYTMTDARNIGISLDSIQAALGKDDNKIFESINRDAATREENIGTINRNKIAAKVSEKDYEFIRKYEKEIITNDNLTESILKGINNTGDAEKVKNIIKSYAEKNPSFFLANFINEPWAKEHIPLAAKNLAEINPYDFLANFINEPWAKEPREDLDGKSFIQYAEEVIKKQSSYSSRLTKLAKVLRSIGLSNEAFEVLRIR